MVSRDLDAIPILDKFVEEHPDFSPFGAKGCLSLTGYEGILGYRTQTDTKSWTEAQEANRQKEIEAVKPIIAELKRTGWTFGSHTWGHIRLCGLTLWSDPGGHPALDGRGGQSGGSHPHSLLSPRCPARRG